MTAERSYTYDAFISYAHGSDHRIAAAIQDGLVRMTRRWEELGSLRIFRDETSLAVGPLEERLRLALEDSRYLIVIASGESAASSWVLGEIRAFLEHQPPENILIVLTQGELTWSANDGKFLLDGKTPFPNIDGGVFRTEPLYVDLRWASDTQRLNLGNERFMDALARLAGTISGVPKDQIVSTAITDLIRLRRNQQINLGFRGLIGFGGVPVLLIMISGEGCPGLEIFLAGFFLSGIAGAVTLGTGWRGAIGFGLGFLAAWPLYTIGILQPVQSGEADLALLTVLIAASFALAGGAGGFVTKESSVRRGAAAFGGGGMIAAALFLWFPDWRHNAIHTFIAEGPWLPDRFVIAASRAIAFVCGEAFYDRSFLTPLMFGAAAGGMWFGIGMAGKRIAIPRRPRRFRGLAAIAGRKTWRILRFTAVAAIVASAIAFAITLTDGYQARAALTELTAVDFSSTFPIGKGESARSWIDAFVVALRAREALDHSGNRAAAAKFSNFVSKWTEQFARTPEVFTASTGDFYRKPEPIELVAIEYVAQAVRKFGRPEEFDRLMTLAHQSARRSSVQIMSFVARIELSSGLRKNALELLDDMESRLRAGNGFRPGQYTPVDSTWHDRSLLAAAWYEAGDTERSRTVLKDLFREIKLHATGKKGYEYWVIRLRLNESLAPESGNAIWGTGVWSELGPLRYELGKTTASAVAAMSASGELSEAVAAVKDANRDWTFNIQTALARAAAQAGKFDTAFGILDGLRLASPGAQDYQREAEALIEIIKAAQIKNRPDINVTAVERLKQIQRSVRNAGYTGSDVDLAKLTICRGFAAARDFPDGWAAVNDLNRGKAEGYASLGTELAESGDSSQARRALRLAWKQFHLNGGLGTGAHLFFSRIGQALAMVGDLRAARYSAEDIGHYVSGDREQIARLLVAASILENATP